MQRITRPLVLFCFALLSSMLLGACSPAGALCARTAECANDPPGPEFEKICRIQYNSKIDALNANEEDSCKALAKAQVAFDSCRAALECVDFNEGDLNSRCSEEKDALQSALSDVDGVECTAFD